MELQVTHLMFLQSQGFESLFREFESPERDLNFAPRGIRICNSKIRIALFDLQPSAFTFAKGFESITRRFESHCLVLHNSSFRDSNRCVGDSNPCFSLSSCSSWEIRIIEWVIRIDGSQLLFFLHRGFKSLDFGFESINLKTLLEFGFESPSSVWTFWNVDSNRYTKDSNRLLRICLKSSRIERFFEGFESPC